MTDATKSAAPRRHRLLRGLGWLLALPGLAWTTLALWFCAPVAAVMFLAGCGTLVWIVRRRPWAPLALLAVTAVVAAVWLALPARNDRSWDRDCIETAWAEIKGDVVTLHNYRNFEWSSETDATPRWETRTFRISQLRQLDFLLTYWGDRHIAHTMLTFDFGPDGHLCASIEARRMIGEPYSALGGMFRRFELLYVLGDERDLVRLRTRFRPHNDVYLFRTNATPAIAQAVFLDYIRTANALRTQPDWYHSLLTNCTTSILKHLRRADVSDPWDWRVLANGHADERLYDFGYISRDLPLPELKRRSHINVAADAADQAPDFSARIRVGLPAF